MADSIDERYIEAFLAIYKCLERNLNMTRELRYKILSDHRTLDDIKLNKEMKGISLTLMTSSKRN